MSRAVMTRIQADTPFVVELTSAYDRPWSIPVAGHEIRCDRPRDNAVISWPVSGHGKAETPIVEKLPNGTAAISEAWKFPTS